MPERVMVVTGAFATHTTKLYNYYVCPSAWKSESVKYIAVNYFGDLKYLGEVITSMEWEFDEKNKTFGNLNNSSVHAEIRNDLEKFKSLLRGEKHRLFLLKPIINNCCSGENLTYKGEGPLTRGHRYFETLGAFFDAHQNSQTEESSESGEDSSSSNDGE